MAFEEHKNRKFQYGNPYADYEYVNKNSRKTGPGLILALLFGIVVLGFAVWRWIAIDTAEASGETISMTSLEWGLYKIGGKWAPTGLFAVLGVFIIYGGIRNFRRLEKIRQS
ncbi:MAG: hypothetical protein EOO09_14785 [Chitinophagaceae bacterium]|nr:MAG: hypothetical protein EOO09_14785 [Chitinophagaceae bacterium]